MAHATLYTSIHEVRHLKDTAPESFYGLIILLTICWLLSLRMIFKTLFAYRVANSTPTTPIRSAAQGAVALKGVQYSASPSPMLSPLTYTPCTWYHYRIEKKTRNIQNNSQWETIYQESSKNPFILRDKTGECIVYPEKASVNVIDDNLFLKYWADGRPWNQPFPANKTLAPWLHFLWNLMNILTLGTLGNLARNQPYRHIETMMKPEEPMTALGFFKTEYQNNVGEHKNAAINTLAAPGDPNTPFLLSNMSSQRFSRVQMQTLGLWVIINVFLLVIAGLLLTVF